MVTVARRCDFDISPESVRRWMRQADIDDGIRDGLTTAEQSELVQLSREKRPLHAQRAALTAEKERIERRLAELAATN